VADSEDALITVLMPVRDYDPRYLRTAVGSLVSQTSGAWRLLVIDDRPSGSAPLADELESWRSDPRIGYARNRATPFTGALNTGMRLAGTDFVASLFADDMWSLDAVAVLSDRIRSHPEVDVFHSSRRFVDDDGAPISGVYRAKTSVTLADFRPDSPVKHLLCWRRSLALEVGGVDEEFRIGADDLDLPWAMAERGAVFMAVDDCLYIYRDHRRTPRLTTDVPRSAQIRDLRRIYRKHGMSDEEIAVRLADAKTSFLRQARYRNALDARLRRTLGLRGAVWREPYRS
jgi:glycosyltransferase involved in cell wall biosynthesis